MAKINDLRSALEYLKTIPGEYIETDKEIDCNSELCGVYRYIGAYGCCPRPTKEGPAMMFNNLKGFPGSRVLIGINGSRKRVGHLLGCEPEKLGFLLKDSVNNLIAPVEAKEDEIKCREVVHLATDPE
ncbi:MAG: UbiD family decarboxylase, partial [Oscillospiraceae bacterium]|nr:UbiD family decarboxylase [Oscillospiraceae bacterium]